MMKNERLRLVLEFDHNDTKQVALYKKIKEQYPKSSSDYIIRLLLQADNNSIEERLERIERLLQGGNVAVKKETIEKIEPEEIEQEETESLNLQDLEDSDFF